MEKNYTMDDFIFSKMERAVDCIPKQNCMGLKFSLDVDALVKVLDEIDEAIEVALRQGHETEEVMNWMRDAEEFILWRLNKKLEDRGKKKCCFGRHILGRLKKRLEEKGKKKCCFGRCSNLKSHYQLSKEKKYVQDVAELLKEIRRTHEEALSKTEQKVAAAAANDFMYFKSRSSVLEEIMLALQSPGINSIGVCGKAGVGKTMLVEEIKRKTEQLKLFDDVVMAKVTRNQDLKRIQDDMVRDLGLELLPNRVTATAADRIKSRLTDRKVLVILDDIRERMDLEEVGIPFGKKQEQKLKQPTKKKNGEISSVEEQTEYTDEQTECILLMTSRDRDVLSRDMDAHTIIEVDQLKEEEGSFLRR